MIVKDLHPVSGMRPANLALRLGWLGLCIWLGFFAGGSGDEYLISGLAFLVLTFPFSVVWWRYIYDYALVLGDRDAVQLVGNGLVIFLAYLFWFEILPRLFRGVEKNRV